MVTFPFKRITTAIKGIISIVLLLIIFFYIFPVKAVAQSDGADLYRICSACHTIGGGNLIGPDLKDISDRRDEEWLIKFIQNSQAMVQEGDEIAVQLLAEFNNIPMPSNALSDDQVRTLLAYIADYGTEEVVSEEKVEEIAETVASVDEEDLPPEVKLDGLRNFRTTFIISLILLMLAIFDLVKSKLIKAKFVHIIIILSAVYLMGEIMVVEAVALGRQQYYSPDQPIAFSHEVHAGQNQIDCQYCHFTAEESMHAGIPPMSLCMNCHNLVKEGAVTGTEEINKIYKAIEDGKPTEWIKVYNLPDHVYFNHSQHVVAGKMECDECHGLVEEMTRVIQIEDLSMGWCIDCHRTTQVQFDNHFYDNYVRLHEDLKTGKKNVINVRDIGGDDCQRCHY